ncbi:MAG: hypothetical protein OHK0052_18390 [Anaerolineales bacterium]
MGLAFVFLVLLSAAAVGAPAALLLQHKINAMPIRWHTKPRKTHKRVTSPVKMSSSAGHCSPRSAPPSANCCKPKTPALANYLQTLQSPTSLNLIVICQNGKIYAQTTESPPQICQTPADNRAHYQTTPAWMLAAQPLPAAQSLVIVGYRLDDAFLRSLQDQNGDMLHILWDADTPIASSAPVSPVSIPWGADGGLQVSNSPIVRGNTGKRAASRYAGAANAGR